MFCYSDIESRLVVIVSCTLSVICSGVGILYWFFFLMIRRPPRSTLGRSSAASDVYKRQVEERVGEVVSGCRTIGRHLVTVGRGEQLAQTVISVSYTHLRAHETVLDLVCRLLLEKKKYHTLLDTAQLSHLDYN